MAVDFYFIDTINFHHRNFYNFLRYIEANHTYFFNTSFPMLKKFHGDYSLRNISGLKNFENHYKTFSTITLSNYKNVTYKGYLLWDIVEPEFKNYLVLKIYNSNNQVSESIEFNNDLVESSPIFFDEPNELEERIRYILCVAAFWIDYWAIEFPKKKPRNVCVFGGTNIFSRCATLIAQWNNINVIAFEGTFIKKFHYADNSSGVITNNHSFSNRSNWVKIQSLELTQEQEDWVDFEMTNKTNLNVVQPSKFRIEDFYVEYGIKTNSKVVLLIGQVMNDYSLTKDMKIFPTSIELYKKVIDYFNNKEGYHLFIKLHPWELKYNQDGITKSVLQKYLEKISAQNVSISYDINLDSLIEVSEIGITACSQAGLEMLYQGKRVVQVGNAFYGNKGWTIDVNHRSLLNDSIGVALEYHNLTITEIKEVKKYLYHFLFNSCFKRNESDPNFLKKFNKIVVLQRDSYINFKIKHSNNRYVNLVKKGLKNPKKAISVVKNKLNYDLEILMARLSQKKIINMVMGEFTQSKIFNDLLDKYKEELSDRYKIVVSKNSIKQADVYQYWRPNRNVNDIKKPSISTVHHDFMSDDESLSLRHFIDSYKNSDVVVCLNKKQEEILKGYGINQTLVVPHGYESVFKFNRIYKDTIDENNKLTIGFCSRRYGRLVKGEKLLYQIIDSLKDYPVKFLFIGKDRQIEYDYCEEKGVEAEVYENIDYKFYPDLYKKMDLFLITSIAEGGPASLPEAMISGLPVLATPCGFIPDFINHGENGFIEEKVEGFVSVIKQLIYHPQKISDIGKKAQETDGLITWSEVVKRYEQIYINLASMRQTEYLNSK